MNANDENLDDLVVLIVEDDDGHAMLIMEHLQEAGIVNKMIRFHDGEEAWDFVSGTGAGTHRDAEALYVMLLDINMPRMSGTELLRKIKDTPRIKKMPVIMLTTTDDPREVEECYQLGCNNYIAKPVDFSQFAEVLHRLGLFIKIIRVAPTD